MKTTRVMACDVERALEDDNERLDADTRRGLMRWKEYLGRRFGWARPYILSADHVGHAAWYCLKYVLKGLRTVEIDGTNVDAADRWGIMLDEGRVVLPEGDC